MFSSWVRILLLLCSYYCYVLTSIVATDTGVVFSVPVKINSRINFIRVAGDDDEEEDEYYLTPKNTTTTLLLSTTKHKFKLPSWIKRQKREGRVHVATRHVLIGAVNIGKQSFQVIFDTGAVYLWVTGKELLLQRGSLLSSWKRSKKTQRKKGYHNTYYDREKSRAFKQGEGSFQLQYDDGTYVSGEMGYDTLKVGGNLVVKGLPFGIADTVRRASGHEVTEYDGIFGLAYGRQGQTRRSPFSEMVQAGILRKNMFAVYMSADRTSGNIMFGGWDRKYFTGPLQFVSVMAGGENLRQEWVVQVDDVGFLDKVAASSSSSSSNENDLAGGEDTNQQYYSALIDTGSSHIRLPNTLVTSIIDNGHILEALNPDTHWHYQFSVPCSARRTLPTLVIKMGGVTFHLTGREYTTAEGMEMDPEGAWRCPLLLAGGGEEEGGSEGITPPSSSTTKKGSPHHRIVIGVPFFRKYYSVFVDHGVVGDDGGGSERRQPEIGFATAIHSKKKGEEKKRRKKKAIDSSLGFLEEDLVD